MLSKEMYELLKQIPRGSKEFISYTKLAENNSEERLAMLGEASSTVYDYIYQSESNPKKSVFRLAEKGQAAIEDYERAAHNQKIVEQTLKVADTAKCVSVISLIVALLSLLKMFF